MQDLHELSGNRICCPLGIVTRLVYMLVHSGSARMLTNRRVPSQIFRVFPVQRNVNREAPGATATGAQSRPAR